MQVITVHQMMITCVVGSVVSGKSTWIDSHYDVNNAVLFRPGKVLRESVGVAWMVTADNPNAPSQADQLVLGLFRSFLRLARDLQRPLVCDGFPRTVAQAIAMKDSCELLGVSLCVDVMLMNPSERLQQQMITKRGKDVFDDARRLRSSADVMRVVDFFKVIQPTQRMRCRITEVGDGV